MKPSENWEAWVWDELSMWMLRQYRMVVGSGVKIIKWSIFQNGGELTKPVKGREGSRARQ